MTDQERRDAILSLVIRLTTRVYTGRLVWKRFTFKAEFDADIGDGNELSLRYIRRIVRPDRLVLFRRPAKERFMVDWPSHTIATGGPMMRWLWDAIGENLKTTRSLDASRLLEEQVAAEKRLLELLRGGKEWN